MNLLLRQRSSYVPFEQLLIDNFVPDGSKRKTGSVPDVISDMRDLLNWETP